MRARPGRGEHGSASVEAVMLTPLMLALLLVAIYGGRVALARQSVTSAAADAARSASIARSASAARAAGDATARATLTNQGLRCATSVVQVDVSAFALRVGTPGSVSATVSCTVALSDLVAPGIPGSRVLVATVDSPLDTYRERAAGAIGPDGRISGTRGTASWG